LDLDVLIVVVVLITSIMLFHCQRAENTVSVICAPLAKSAIKKNTINL